MPARGCMLVQVLTALEFGGEDKREKSSRLLHHILLASQKLIRPYVTEVLQAVLPALDVADWRVLEDEAEMAAIAAANELAPMVLSDPEIADLIAFLDALTDPREDRLGVPDAVPSGLPVAR